MSHDGLSAEPFTGSNGRSFAVESPEIAVIDELRMPPRRYADFSAIAENGIDLSSGKKPKRNWLRRLYVTLRKLIRRRQESAAMRICRLDAWREASAARASADAAKREADEAVAKLQKETDKRLKDRERTHSEAMQRLERKITSLEESLRSHEKTIRDQADLTIPKLQNELKVAQMYTQYLESLVAKKLAHEQAQIAVDNRRIADVEDPPQLNSMQQILRGEP